MQRQTKCSVFPSRNHHLLTYKQTKPVPQSEFTNYGHNSYREQPRHHTCILLLYMYMYFFGAFGLLLAVAGSAKQTSQSSGRRSTSCRDAHGRRTRCRTIMDDDVLYRLASASTVPDDAWRMRLQWMSAFAGEDDTFVQLSTGAQLADEAEARFAGKADVMLLCFSVDSMRDEADLKIRWESDESASGPFPKIYGGAIPYACLAAQPALLALGPDGKHEIPALGVAAAAAASALSGQAVKAQEDDFYVSGDDEYEDVGCNPGGFSY